MIKSKKQMFSLIGVFTFVLMLGTVTYAFFNYTRTGTANSIRVGKIYFNSEQNEPINLTNMFPIDPTEQGIMDDDTKVGTVTIDVIGDTTYENGVEYLISAVNVSNTVNNKQLPISINVTYEEAEDETIGTLDNDYFTNRNSTQTSIYKVLATDTINNDDQIVVGYIAPGQEGIDGTITIKAYLDKNRIAISDTYDGNETDNMGTTNEWVGDREVFTTNEWNSLQQNGVSFQVKVEANEGTWVNEPVPTIPSCPGCRFIYTTNTYNYGTNGDLVSDITEPIYDNYNDAMSGLRHHFLGFTTSNGRIDRAFACGIAGETYNGNNLFCVEGTADENRQSEVFAANSNILMPIYGERNNGIGCYTSTFSGGLLCDINSQYWSMVYGNGEVTVATNDIYDYEDSACQVRRFGTMYCHDNTGN